MRSARSSRPSCASRLSTFSAAPSLRLTPVGGRGLGGGLRRSRLSCDLPKDRGLPTRHGAIRFDSHRTRPRAIPFHRTRQPSASGRPRPSDALGEVGQVSRAARASRPRRPPGRPPRRPTRRPWPASRATPTSTWPASTMHGRAARRRDRRDAVDDLAGARGEVVGALPRHDEVVRGRQLLGQADRVGDQLDARDDARRPAASARSRGRRRLRHPWRRRPGARPACVPHAALRRTGRAGRRPSMICSSVRPFCGPNVLVAPNMPSSVTSTSAAMTSSTPASRSRAGPRSTCGDAGERRPGPRRAARRRWRRGPRAGPLPRRWSRCRRARRRRGALPRRRRRRSPGRRRTVVASIGSRVGRRGAARRPGRSRRTPCRRRAAPSPARRLAERPADA